MKYCNQCGQQLPDEARFCGACGASLTEPIIDSAATIALADAPPGTEIKVSEAMGLRNDQDNSSNAQGYETPIENTKQKRLGLKWKIIISSVLAIFMVAGGIWGWWNMSTESRVQAKLDLAVKYLSENNYEKAVLAYNDAIKIEPKEVLAYQGLAKTYTLQGKYDEAKDTYDRGLAVTSADDKTSLQLSQAGMYIDQNNLATAEKTLQDIIAKKTDCIEAYQGLSMIYSLLNDREKARQIIEKALAQNPQSYQAYNLLARFYMIDDQEKALQQLLKSLQLEPDQQEAFAILKEMYEDHWDDLLVKLDTFEKSKTVALVKMYMHYQLKEYTDALKFYENELSDDQSNLKPAILAAISYRLIGETEKAEELIDKVIKGDPNAWIMVDIAWYYKTAGNEEQALDYVNRAFETGEGNLEALKLLAEALGSEQQNIIKVMTAMHIVYNWQPIIYINKELAREKIEPCFAIAGNAGWPGDFAGSVSDADSGAAISGASLEIYDDKGALVTKFVTDAHGKYAGSLSPGSYRIIIKALLYVNGEQNGFKVTNEESMVFNPKLKRTASASGLKGIIQDAVSRAPITDAKIDIIDASKKNVSTIYSDAIGKFELLLLPAADYTINISKEGYLSETYEAIAITPKNTVFLETILQVQNGPATGTFDGHIYNALNGAGVGNLTIDFRRGINNKSGNDVAFTVQTNPDGSYQAKNVKPGNYTGEARGDGYVKANFTAVCVGGKQTPKQDGTITPVLPAGQTRIVLSWGQSPRDLDAHLTGPKDDGTRFNVYYNNRRCGDYVDLDIDDTSSYGPETITIRNQIAGIYRFSVHDYSNSSSSSSSKLSYSNAKVQVFRGSEPVQVFYVPANMGGTLWEVFEINGNILTPINRLSYQSSSSRVP